MNYDDSQQPKMIEVNEFSHHKGVSLCLAVNTKDFLNGTA